MYSCFSCIFYESYEKDKGFCHRYPPENGVCRVKSDWWCGEYRPYEEEKEQEKENADS